MCPIVGSSCMVFLPNQVSTRTEIDESARAKCLPTAGPAALAVPASAAFGNSFALPAVFLTTLLPKAVADRALGYAALFLLAWSPCLWSIGLALVSGQQGQALRAPQLGNGGGGQALGASRQEHLQQADETVARRPLYWREPRVVDITPLTAQSNSTGKDDKLALPEPPGWAEKLAVHPTTAKLCQFAAQVSAGAAAVIYLRLSCIDSRAGPCMGTILMSWTFLDAGAEPASGRNTFWHAGGPDARWQVAHSSLKLAGRVGRCRSRISCGIAARAWPAAGLCQGGA